MLRHSWKTFLSRSSMVDINRDKFGSLSERSSYNFPWSWQLCRIFVLDKRELVKIVDG